MPHIVHVDIAADDQARATRFYEQVFGWQIQTLHGETAYQLINTAAGEAEDEGDDRDGEPISAGISQRSTPAQGITPLLGVDSIDAVAERIVAAGGTVLGPKTLIPGIGYLLRFRDTEGNVLGLVEELSETLFAMPGGRA